MSEASERYWVECIECAFDECGLTATQEQIESVAKDVRLSHDNYDMAFYSPPSSDRISEIESEWKEKLRKMESEMVAYRSNAETAIKQALRVNSDSNVSIGERGEVFRHGGRTEQIQ